MHSQRSSFRERLRLSEFENILVRILLTTLVSMVKFFRDNEMARKLTLACFLRRKSYRFTCGDVGKLYESISESILFSEIRNLNALNVNT